MIKLNTKRNPLLIEQKLNAHEGIKKPKGTSSKIVKTQINHGNVIHTHKNILATVFFAKRAYYANNLSLFAIYKRHD